MDLPASSRNALHHVSVSAQKLSMETRPWCSEKVVAAAMKAVREADVVIHLDPYKVLHFLINDTHYRNQFETRTSSATLSEDLRNGWEDEMFHYAYRHASAFEKPKYGCLNIFRHRRGDVEASGLINIFPILLITASCFLTTPYYR